MDQTIAYYDKNAEKFCETTRNADMCFCRNKFLSLIGENAHILDAGCGSGRDSKAFLDAGYRVTAMDASAKVCKEAEVFFGQEVLCKNFESIDFRQEFDGIWACASLLHVTKEKINDVLKRLWIALKNKGVLYASFKYGEGERVVNGRFFNDYNELTLKDLVEINRFDIEEIFITKDVRIGRETERWVNVLARKG